LAERVVRFCPVPAGASSRINPAIRPRVVKVVRETFLPILRSFPEFID
jgi:hypothetical protein